MTKNQNIFCWLSPAAAASEQTLAGQQFQNTGFINQWLVEDSVVYI